MTTSLTSSNGTFRLYSGKGSALSERGLALQPLSIETRADDPRGYIAEDGLRDAVNVALALGQPLLVTGEPGTGKTQLAYSVAYELGLSEPFVFNTKSTTAARDLFYRYDTLRHFHDAQFRKEALPLENYLEYDALGLAILLAMPAAERDDHLPYYLRDRRPMRSVVLIDEIDKAPRDVPNDVLQETDRMCFTVKETGHTFSADPSLRPILILTSNSEKNLPDAFLRRCIFYHIAFPSRERLRNIVEQRIDANADFSPRMLEAAIAHFEQLRALALRKKPATAELLAWLRVLGRLHLDVENLRPGDVETLGFTYSILAKNKEDLAVLQERLG